MSRRKARLSWRIKLALLLASFTLIPLVLASYFSLEEQERQVRKQVLTSTEALVRTKAEAIGQFADFRRRDAERIATLLGPALIELIEAKRSTPTAEPPADQLPELDDAAEPEPTDEPPESPEGSGSGGQGTDGSGGEGTGDTGGTGGSGGDTDDPGSEGADAKATDRSGAERPAATSRSERTKGETRKVDRKDTGEPPLPPPDLEQVHRSLHRTLDLIAWDLAEFEELLIIDNEGRVIASTFEKHQGHNASALRYFHEGLDRTFLEPVFLSPITGELTMVIATPIEGPDAETLGVLAARLNLERFFRLINDTTGLGATGEVLAGRFDDEQGVVVFTAPTRRNPDAALHEKIAIGSPHAIPVQEASRGQTGSGPALDYDGVPVLAAWQHVPSLDWGLVVKINTAEVLAPVDEARQAVWVGSALLLLLAVVAALIVSAVFMRPLQSLREATDRLSRGDFNVSIDIRSNDEIGQLADSFERMVASIKYFREHSRMDDSIELDREEAEALMDPPSGEGSASDSR